MMEYETRMEGEGVRRNLQEKWIKRVDEYWREEVGRQWIECAGGGQIGNAFAVATLVREQKSISLNLSVLNYDYF